MERPLSFGQILPRSFCPKRDWNGGVAKLIVTKYSPPRKAIIGGCGIKTEKEHQYPMLRGGKDQILRGIVYQKDWWTILLQYLQIVFTFLACLSGTSSREIQRSWLLNLSVIGQLKVKAGVFGHLTGFYALSDIWPLVLKLSLSLSLSAQKVEKFTVWLKMLLLSDKTSLHSRYFGHKHSNYEHFLIKKPFLRSRTVNWHSLL